MVSLQQIDEMLAGSLTQEDEDAVLAELEAITQVGAVSIAVKSVYTSLIFDYKIQISVLKTETFSTPVP